MRYCLRGRVAILLILITLVYIILVSSFFGETSAQEAATISVVNPTNDDIKFIFFTNTTAVNDTFTVNVYIHNVVNLVSWQITLKWNNSVVRYSKAWIPEDNVFASAIEEGATLIAPKPSVDIWVGDEAYLKYGATILPKIPVTITGRALLCKINFTIAALPSENETQRYTNIAVVQKLDPLSASLDSYVILKDKSTPVPILMEPAVVRIIRAEAPHLEVLTDVAVVALRIRPSSVVPGQIVEIEVMLANLGEEIAKFNLTIRSGEMILKTLSITLAPKENRTYIYNWNTTGVVLKNFEFTSYLNIQIPLYMHDVYVISVEISGVEDDVDTSNHFAEASVKFTEKLEGLNYVRYFLLLVLSSPLGHAFSIYVISICAGIILYHGYKRLKLKK